MPASAPIAGNLVGYRSSKTVHCEPRSARRFNQDTDEYLDARLVRTLYHSAYFPFMELCGAALMALVLWYGVGQVFARGNRLGVLVAMLQYVPRFFMPIRNLAEEYATVQVAMASSERIFELIDAEPEPVGGPVRRERVAGAIEFRTCGLLMKKKNGSCATFPSASRRARSLALVGATGSGKTTIVSLLCRFYEIQRGQILVDGIDIREWDIEALRRRFGLVQQDVFLFAGDIASNIRLGAPELSDAAVAQTARYVNADRFIDRLPDTYQHEVQERGATLSAGQRQLLSFARALAADPGHFGAGRSHRPHRHRDRRLDPRGRGKTDARPHLHCHCPPPLHHPQRRQNPRAAPRRVARRRPPRRTAGPRRHLRPPASIAIQRGSRLASTTTAKP